MKASILKEGKEYNQDGRIPGRRDDGGRRQRAQDDQQDDRHRRHRVLQTTGEVIFGRYIEQGMTPQASAPAPQVAAAGSSSNRRLGKPRQNAGPSVFRIDANAAVR